MRPLPPSYSQPGGPEALQGQEFYLHDALLLDEAVVGPTRDDLICQVRQWYPDLPILLVVRDTSRDHLLGLLHADLDGTIATPLQALLERLKAKAKVRRSVQKKELILDQYKRAMDASLIIARTDREGVITYVNDNFCRLSGFRADEIIGQPHRLFKHPKTSKEKIRDLWETITAKQVWHNVLINRAKSGGTF